MENQNAQNPLPQFSVTVDAPDDCTRVLSFQVPVEAFDAEKSNVMDALRRDLRVPGFRKGKVPQKYVEKNYAEIIKSDAVRNLLPNVYEEALEREGIHPISEPRFDKIETESGSDVTFEVTVEVRPDVEVKGYDKVKVKVERNKVDDTTVEETLKHLQERMTTLRVVDRAVRAEDVAVIDYGPLDDASEVEKDKLAQNYPVDLGGGNLLAELRDGIVGMEMKETKDIVVNYPEDFPEKEMAGARKVFRVTLKEVKERVTPELDDDFAKQAGEQFETLDALRAQVGEDLVKDEEKRYLHDVEERIIDKLIEKNTFDVPQSMVDNYLTSILEEQRRRQPHVEDEVEREKQVREHFRDAAVRAIKKYIILEAVRQQESLDLGEGDIDARIEEMAGENPTNADQVRQFFTHPDRRRSLENEMVDRKVLQFLRDAADVETA